MTQINWEEQTLPFRCYDCGHQSPIIMKEYPLN
jgi:hypothetical protein